MHLSNTAVLLLGALQPALGARTFDTIGDVNEVEAQYITTDQTFINYHAPNHGCGGYRAWVGIWPADVCDYFGDYKAWDWVESTRGFGNDFNTVKFSNNEIGVGKFKAAFVCEDGRRQPWLVSQPFTIDKAPEAAPGQCVYRASKRNPEWKTIQCDELSDGFCGFCRTPPADCDNCDACKSQCGLAN